MTEQISMIELFSGIGAQERALRQLGLPYSVTNTCDCDANAVLSYAAMRWDLEKEMETFEFPSQDTMITELQAKNLGYDFQKGKHTITKRTPIPKLKQYYIADKLSKNLGDISKVDRLPYANIVTYSFPCTDVSVAGKGEGMANKCEACGHSWPIDFSNATDTLICPECGAIVESSTRSGLLGQVQRLLAKAYQENELPNMLLMENVKNLTGQKYIGQFETWVRWLDSIGYDTYWKVLNAKNFGIPQNRERVFAISIRKDVNTKDFIFPEQIPLTIRLKDILEKAVDEKYYLPDERIEKILNSTFIQEKKRIQMTDVCDTLLARDWKDPKCVPVKEPEVHQIMNVMPGTHRDNPNQGRVYDVNGLAPTLTKMDGGNRQPFIVDEIKVVGNYMPSNHDASRVVDIDGIAPTVKENHGTVTAIAEPIVYDDYNSRISADQDAINTLTCNCGASAERNGVKIIEPVIIEDFYQSRNPRVYTETAPTIRSERAGLKAADGEIEYPCSTRGKQVASAIRASIYKQGARNLEENVVNGLGYEGVIEQEKPKIRWRIRKLTPKCCWRLMNFTDKDCDSAAKYVSPSALYKQAGNSIVVACLIAIMSSLFVENGHKAEVWTKYTLNFND